jgi:predicted permease
MAAVPCALFSLSASLTCYRITGNTSESLSIVTIKNMIHPVFVWLLVTYLLDVPDFWAKVAVFLAIPSDTQLHRLQPHRI